MEIDKNTVEKIAALARLQFSEEEKEVMISDLNKILTYIDKLKELDTENVEPLIYVNEDIDRLRKDESRIEITKAQALKNAPQKDSDYFRVPKVLKKD